MPITPPNGEPWTPGADALVRSGNVETASARRWRQLQESPEVLLVRRTADRYEEVREQPNTVEEYQQLRVVRSDFAWVKSDRHSQIPGDGILVAPGIDSPFMRSALAKDFFETQVAGRTLFEILAEAGWLLAQFEHFAGSARLVELRNSHPDLLRFVDAAPLSHWDLGPFGDPVPATTQTPVSLPHPSAGLDQVSVLVADSGLRAGPVAGIAVDPTDVVATPSLFDDFHGEFIANLILGRAPNATVSLSNIRSGSGLDVFQLEFFTDLHRFLSDATLNSFDAKMVVNCSFGGLPDAPDSNGPVDSLISHYLNSLPNLVMVAAAGNQALNDPTWRPAGFTDATIMPSGQRIDHRFVSVGAADGVIAASFSNFGPWVRAYAPGVNVVSRMNQGTFLWSGTSFSAPIVTGHIARELAGTGVDADAAVTAVLGSTAPPAIDNKPFVRP